MTNPQNYPRKRPENFLGSGESRRWPTYLGITGLLLFILVALAGGIIWYNSKKSSELAIAAAQRLMHEADEKITDRIRAALRPDVRDRRHRLAGAGADHAGDQGRSERHGPAVAGIAHLSPNIVALCRVRRRRVLHGDPYRRRKDAPRCARRCKHPPRRSLPTRSLPTMPPASAPCAGSFSPRTARSLAAAIRRRRSIPASDLGTRPPSAAM